MIFHRLLHRLQKGRDLSSDKRSHFIYLGIIMILGCLAGFDWDFVFNWKAGTDRILIFLQTIADPLARLFLADDRGPTCSDVNRWQSLPNFKIRFSRFN